MFPVGEKPVEQNRALASDVLTNGTRVNDSPASYYPTLARPRSRWQRWFKSLRFRRQPRSAILAAITPGARRAKPAPASPKPQPLKDPFSSLRIRLVGTVFVATVPPMVLMHFFHLEDWAGFLVGLLALVAAWYGGERFILRQLRVLLNATQRLAAGDMASRTGMGDVKGELGQLARTFDTLAESLQQRSREREQTEKLLLSRAQQQTVVAALGQFAMVSQDFVSMLNQAMQLVSQTLETPFVSTFELHPDGQSLLLRAGVGWRPGRLGNQTIEAHGQSLVAFVLNGGGAPVVTPSLREERRFYAPTLLIEHGVASGICVIIATRLRPYGVLGAFSNRTRLYTEDEVQFLMSVANTLSMAAERARAEAELQKLAAFAQLNPNAALELSPDGTITYFNDSALRLAISVDLNHPRDILPPNVSQIAQACLTSGNCRAMETRLAGRTWAWSFHPVATSHVVHCYVEDITERLSLESQLRQAQKMDSVGQLAAGVAHDFNNMLSIIEGHAGMLLARTDLPTKATDSAQAVFFAAERAASLTRQLLMFSRKNVMQPKLLDLREVVANLSKMLRRLIGETITLEFAPPAELPLVNGDCGMIEQVIMNLCVNARDAMAQGGTLTIGLCPIEVGADYAQAHPESGAGAHVCLRVTDTGCGMDSYLIGRIFEPFFTTKEVGKGTGLGLATVYGIVKQHNGWVEVASKPGCGTTFNVFFPASKETAKPISEVSATTAPVVGGRETLLIVEDEPVLREMAEMLLQECGYRVLVAANGREAVELWAKHRDSIDLLFTDMVMPAGISGMELANKLLHQNPQLRIVFASGYTVDDVSTDFLSRNNDARFLQKPYTGVTLTRAVREALDGDATRQRTASPLLVPA
jgi:signal transduction histidine kinase/CheY-like chemotaxis protein/HAMP domain-containing protein